MENDLFRSRLGDGSWLPRLAGAICYPLLLKLFSLILSRFCYCSVRPRPLDYTTINNSQLTPVSKEG